MGFSFSKTRTFLSEPKLLNGSVNANKITVWRVCVCFKSLTVLECLKAAIINIGYRYQVFWQGKYQTSVSSKNVISVHPIFSHNSSGGLGLRKYLETNTMLLVVDVFKTSLLLITLSDTDCRLSVSSLAFGADM
jgi:hypothetical protein